MYKYRMLLIFLLLLFICSNTKAFVKELPLLNKKIYLDAGHGGKDPGAYYKDIYEEDINLKIVLKLKNKIESLGGIVYLTRDDDYDLSKKGVTRRKKSDLGNRAKLINDSDADIYLSIHLNSSIHTNWKGAQAFYDDINDKNKEIALVFQKGFNKNLNSEETYKFIKKSFEQGRIETNGTEISAMLPPMSMFSKDNNRQIKKNTVIDKLMEFFDKFFSITDNRM